MGDYLGRKSEKDLTYGPVRALVEYRKDPLRLGRVRVRIPQIHGRVGEEPFIQKEDLPWASPCVPYTCIVTGKQIGRAHV